MPVISFLIYNGHWNEKNNMIKKIFSNLPFRLALALFVGISGGLVANAGVMQVVVTVQNLLNEIIMFVIPLIIIGFIAPSITQLGGNASRLLGIALLLAYLSSVGASLFSVASGYVILPHLHIVSDTGEGRALPEVIFDLQIPPVMSVMSALAFSVLIGIAATWRRAGNIIAALNEFQGMVLLIVTRVIIPILPFFIACTFCSLSYEGLITRQLPVFLIVILIVIAGHYIWMALLYSLAAIYSKKNPFRVLRHYRPAYLTAIGTMSSAATLPVSLECARKSGVLRRDMIDFGIPLFANIHLCGSVLTETFFVMTVSLTLYGNLPSLSSLLLFSILLGIFAIGAPGVPGGTVMASLGLIVSVLGFDAAGTALMLTIFALQDSFGTACNVTSDGALTLIISEYRNRMENKVD
jgi:Na+/H+-dicarboxylate symporter